MVKRRHGLEKFPDIEVKLRTGEYSLREPADKKKHSCEVTWKQMRYIYDEFEQPISDMFCCSKCKTIFNLKLRDSGKVLKTHVENKCPGDTGRISGFFVPEYEPTKKRKINVSDRLLVRDAAIGYVIEDMRPINSLSGRGMTKLLSNLTYVGAKYGHFTEEALMSLKLVPSRQTVSVVKILA